MVGDWPTNIPRLRVFDLHDIAEKAYKLEGPLRQRISACPQVWVVIEEMRQMVREAREVYQTLSREARM